jgi:RNA polymerase sigma-70 factor (ECF subfamily)
MSRPGLASPEATAEAAATAARGEAATVETIYRRHSRDVARWAIRLLGPNGDFEDVVHDVFLVVRRRWPEFRGEAEITTWLYEITVRVAQRFRRRARWWWWVTGRGESPSRGQGHLAFRPWQEASVDPQVLLEARERTRVLYRLLDDLNEEQRTTFILFELEGMSGVEIAKITRTSVATVWVRLSRARRRFLEHMRQWEERENP